MTVNVEFFGQLAEGTQRYQVLILDQPMKVREVASVLEIDTEHIGLIAINSVQCELDDWYRLIAGSVFFHRCLEGNSHYRYLL